MKRGVFAASAAALTLAGCAKVTNSLNEWEPARRVLETADTLNELAIGTRGMAKLYRETDITEDFPTNSLPTPTAQAYERIVNSNYALYTLPIGGLVEHPQTFTYRHLRALASVNQITRHDCVEGWSVVGKWGGVRLATLLALVRPKPDARYVVFYSFDRDSDGTPFYGSLDLLQAAHPQTLLALDLNGKRIDPAHGGPARLRIPTQLGYKSTKWVDRIALVPSYAGIFGGRGGYWEDQGYAWYAGI